VKHPWGRKSCQSLEWWGLLAIVASAFLMGLNLGLFESEGAFTM